MSPNPKSNWASGAFAPANRPIETEFEICVRGLALTKDAYAASSELRRWCELNRNRHYVPEWLLECWGIGVDPDLT